ncbi:MAG: hypothetical protein KZQ93_15830 [Candidatus Thiodiazotropha sp. (ex Monitilora ramsayi)]|nr:hypothetical protein [Candidatus Thiodiazotropha sp. (ex Monitilora ramsayi)]
MVEGNAFTLDLSFTDRDGVSATPESVSYKVLCLTTGLEVQADADAGVPSAQMELTIAGSLNAILDPVGNEREKRRVVVTTTTAGEPFKGVFDYYVKKETA